MDMINSVYNYYLTTYAGNNKLLSNNAHKKSELREVYNNILRISRKSPLYKLDLNEDVQKYAIDLKENAYSLKEVAESLDSDSILKGAKKKANSSNENKITARYIGTESDSDSPDFDIEVSHLATPQINTGNYLSQNKLNLPRGEYSFDININEYSYELQFKVNDSDTNRTLQDKLARLVNRSDIGITAEVKKNSSNNSALSLTSVSTGLGFKPQIFSIVNNSDNLGDIVDYLGLNQMTTEPSNARFTLNGEERSSSSNTFTINKGFEISLKDTTDDETVHIGFKPDFDSIMESVSDLTSKYNHVADMAAAKAEGNGDSSRLTKELTGIYRHHKNSLESVGITSDDAGHLNIDESLVSQAIDDNNIADSLSVITSFTTELGKLADGMSINPMRYVDKTMISYPNPVISFSNPYVTSIYTGMMFNGYI